MSHLCEEALLKLLRYSMECSWKEDKSIDVHGEVIVRPPYVAGSCSGRNNKAVEHVAKLLNATREQLGLN